MKESNNWVEIFPYGVTLAADQSRPIMLFKDKTEELILPVWLSPLDAGITIQQNAVSVASSPYQLTWRILKPLEIYLRKCCFTEVKGLNQYVELYFEGHPKLKTLKSRADQAVSFCLSAETQFYCKADYFSKCRVLETQINEASKSSQKFSLGLAPGSYLN